MWNANFVGAQIKTQYCLFHNYETEKQINTFKRSWYILLLKKPTFVTFVTIKSHLTPIQTFSIEFITRFIETVFTTRITAVFSIGLHTTCRCIKAASPIWLRYPVRICKYTCFTIVKCCINVTCIKNYTN